MGGGSLPQIEASPDSEAKTVDRAFGSANRNRLIDRYFETVGRGGVTPDNAWKHVYRLLLWSDPTIGLAHCYESDKSQPGKPWYARSLAFHDWVSSELGVEPGALGGEIDWLFLRACGDLAAALVLREHRLASVAAQQRQAYEGRGFPEPGADPELASMIRHALSESLANEPSAEQWNLLTHQVRQFLAVQNKRKNLVGEGFEDVLGQIIRRACNISEEEVRVRTLLHELRGFNRARSGGKENKVDLALIRPSARTIVTAKWSVRADREKQFQSEYEEYCNAESANETFQYVFITNEFDPARLMRACEQIVRNRPMFDYVVHISTDAVRATYGDLPGEDRRAGDSKRRVLGYIETGRLISLERWLRQLV